MQHHCLKCHRAVELPDDHRFNTCPHCGAVQKEVRLFVGDTSDTTSGVTDVPIAVLPQTESHVTPKVRTRVHAVAKLAYCVSLLCVMMAIVESFLGMRGATSAPQQAVALCLGLAWAVIPYVAARAIEKVLA